MSTASAVATSRRFAAANGCSAHRPHKWNSGCAPFPTLPPNRRPAGEPLLADLHLGEGCLAALQCRRLVLAANGADHDFDVRNGPGYLGRNRNRSRGLPVRTFSAIALVFRPGHLVHFI